MKIAINVLNTYSGGGVKATISLLSQLALTDADNAYLLIASHRQPEIIAAAPPGCELLIFRRLPANPFLRVLWEQLVLPFSLAWRSVDVLYSAGNYTVLLAPCKVVLFVENATPFSPLAMRWSRRERIRNTLIKFLTRISAKKAALVRFCSDNSRRIIALKLQLKAEKCVTIHHACEPTAPSVSLPRPHPRNYLLGLGVIGPTKNWKMLVRAFGLLVDKFHYGGDLLIVGDEKQFPFYTRGLQNTINSLGLQTRVYFCGFVANEETPRYYQNADAFVMSSLEDTFGIPVIEAMGCGTPIVATDGELHPEMFIPFREICGNAADYFDPLSPEAMATSIQRVISDADYKRKLVAAGHERIKSFSPRATTKSLVAVFHAAHRRNALLRG